MTARGLYSRHFTHNNTRQICSPTKNRLYIRLHIISTILQKMKNKKKEKQILPPRWKVKHFFFHILIVL